MEWAFEQSPNSHEYLQIAINLLGWTEEQYMDACPRHFHSQLQDYLKRHPEDLVTAQWLDRASAKYEKLAAILEAQQSSEAR